MVINMKNEISVHDKAIRLIEGGIVSCNGHSVRAIDVIDTDNPCMLCDMDSACNMDMVELCAECDSITHSKHILKFAHTTS